MATETATRQTKRAARRKLLSVSADAKTVRGELAGYVTGILYMMPAETGGIGNLCPHSSAGCRGCCLVTAGRGIMSNVQAGRQRKTDEFKKDRAGFMLTLQKDVAALQRRAQRRGQIPTVRPNGTADLPWENIKGADGRTIVETFPTVQFYDYTKSSRRMRAFLRGDMPANYHLTFSRSECNVPDALAILRDGGNVSVVFETKKGRALPSSWNGFPVIDGDTSDLRFRDGSGVVIGLRAKGKAKKDDTGFVVRRAMADGTEWSN